MGGALHPSERSHRRRVAPRKLESPAVARIASTVLVVALLAATAAAFALTQGLKLQKSPIFGTQVQPRLLARLRLRQGDGANCVQAAQGGPDRRLDRRRRRGRADDRARRAATRRVRSRSSGTAATTPAGSCPRASTSPGSTCAASTRRSRCRTRSGSTCTPPVIQDVRVTPRVVSPDGDGRERRAHVRYRLNEEGRGALFVNGRRRALTRFPRTEETIVWNAKVRGRPVRPGAYALQLAGVRPGRKPLRADAGDSRRASASWRSAATGSPSPPERRSRCASPPTPSGCAGRSAAAAASRRPGTLRLRAPLQKGRFTLTVSANGHTARAAVFVREPLR